MVAFPIDNVTLEVWEPNPGPQEFVLRLDGFREILYGGARGGGKTEAGLVWIGPMTNTHPKFRGLVLRRNAVDLADWLERAEAMWAPMGVKKRGNAQSPVFVFPTGGVVRTGHMADEKSYNKYLGHNYHKALIEELTQIPTLELYLKLTSCVRSKIPELPPSIFCTTNPGGDGHGWVKERFVDSAPPGRPIEQVTKLPDGRVIKSYAIFVRSLLDDNPHLANNDPEYEAFLMSLPDALRRAWRYGDWNAFAGQYFPEFRPNIHVIPGFRIPEHWRRYRTMDWGYWPDPWVCLWIAVDEDGREYVYREAKGNRMPPADVAREILRLSADDGPHFGPTVADTQMWTPAADDGVSHAEKCLMAGLPLDQASKDRLNGWMRIHEYLALDPRTGQPGLVFFDNCTETIKCLPQLIHDEKRVEDVKGNSAIDHFPDALRYHLMRRPTKTAHPERFRPWNSIENYRRLAGEFGE
jgi:hypothetical protein